MSNKISITCTQDTYLDSSSNADYSNASLLKSKRWYPGDTPSYIPIVQFDIPSDVKYSKIISAKIYYTMQQVDAIDTIYGAHIRAFSASSIIVSNIRYNNYPTYGTFTEPLVIDDQVILSTVGGGYSSTYSTSADVTSLLQNNIINDIFTVAINLRCNYLNTRIRGYGSTSPITLEIEYENVIPDPPTLMYPVDVYLNQDLPISFKWVYNTQSGAKQAKVELEWKKNSDSVWTPLATVSSSNTYIASANAFPVSQIDWRCRTTDELGQVGEYSSASFLIKGKPLAPFITNIANDSLTTIEWNATDQIAREIMLIKNGVVIDSSRQSTADNTYLPNLFLDDGTYEFRIRIMNSYNLWSDYTSKIFNISTNKPSKPAIKTLLNGSEVTIISEQAGYLYRVEDGISVLIHVFSEAGSYIDREVKSNVKTGYFLRVYNVGFTDSSINYVVSKYHGFILDNGIVKVNIYKSKEDYVPFSQSLLKVRSLNHYSGREFPVEEIGEFKEMIISRTCYVDLKQYNKMLELYYSSSPIIYRDDKGRRFQCSIESINITNEFLDRGYNIVFTLNKLNEEEVSIR